MRFLTRFSLRNPVAVVILVLLIAVGGVFSALGLQEDLMPDMSVPILSVLTTYPGASPAQVAADVTDPIEKALTGAQDVQTITSTSIANVSQIELQLTMNANVNADAQNVQQILSQVQLPSSAGTPAVKSFSFSNTPVLEFTVASDKLSSRALKRLVNGTVVPLLQGVAGVATVNAFGAGQDNVLLQFNAHQLAHYHLSLQQVLQELQASNTAMPLGTATVAGKVMPVQMQTTLHSLNDIRHLPIAVSLGTATNDLASTASPIFGRSVTRLTQHLNGQTPSSTIPLSNLATVSLGPPAGTSINRTNGQPSILVTVSKTENANTVSVATAVKKTLSGLKAQLPNGVSLATLFDSSQMIQASVNGVLHEAVLGAIFAVIVILLFLRNWLTTLVAIVSIPLSILTAVILLARYGVTLNIMTLGGLAVATGRVVDDSIVVIENIYRTWRTGYGYGKKLVLYATSEVSAAILSSTLATIAVFLPLAMVGGMVGKIFFPFALTVVCSLASSLIVALTVVPLLAWLFVVRKPAKDKAYPTPDADGFVHESAAFNATLPTVSKHAGEETGRRRVARHGRPWQRRYQRTLNWCLDHKARVIVLTVVIFIASLSVLPIVGSTFIQNSMQQAAAVSIKLPVGTPITVTDALAKQVENALKPLSTAIALTDTSIGGGGNEYQADATTSNTATLYLKLRPQTDVNHFLKTARNKVAPLATPGTVIQVKGQMSGGGGTSFDLVVNGPNATVIGQAANSITKKLEGLPGLANITSNLGQMQPEITVVPNQSKLIRAGLTSAQLAGVVQYYVSQQKVGTVRMNHQSYTLAVTLKNASTLNSLSAIRALPVQTAEGTTVSLGDVATVNSVPTPTSILHENGQDYAEITADYTTQDTGKTLKQALQQVHAMKLPSGVMVGQSASALQQTQSFSQLIEAIVVAVGIVYIVMLILFGEWSAPFAILFSMPVALIGAFLGTFVAHQPLSVSSLIGILMLMGIVVTNAIVLIQRVEQQRALGMTVRAALLEAGSTRLRPILMTAVATICALLPLGVGASEGLLISQGLAVVVIGGLVTSTILTLCIVPIMYELLHWRIHRRETQAAGRILE